MLMKELAQRQPVTSCSEQLPINETLHNAKEKIMSNALFYRKAWGVCEEGHPAYIIDGWVVCGHEGCSDLGHFEGERSEADQN